MRKGFIRVKVNGLLFFSTLGSRKGRNHNQVDRRVFQPKTQLKVKIFLQRN